MQLAMYNIDIELAIILNTIQSASFYSYRYTYKLYSQI